MKIETESVYNLRNIPRVEQEVRILTMRTWPRGIKHELVDIWLPDAGPSKALLDSYRRQEITWEQFRTAYIAEQRALTVCTYTVYKQGIEPYKRTSDCSPLEYLQALRHQETEDGWKVKLLCWERSGNCHRHVLKELIERKDDNQ